MNRLEKEAVSRIALLVMAIVLLAVAAGILVLVIAMVHDLEAYRAYRANHYGVVQFRPAWQTSYYQSGYTTILELLVLAMAIVAAGVYMLIGCLRLSVNTEREPEDPRYRIK